MGYDEKDNTLGGEVMDLNLVLQAISSVGFPIVMCCALFWKIDKQDKEHRDETNKLAESINNNTIAMQKLIDRLENLKKEENND